MHYYQFNIGDYASHTAHLDPLEDIAYRRMLDWVYLHESPLPLSVKQISKYIRMRDECERIADVLQQFFTETEYGYAQKKAEEEIIKFRDKSEKAKKAIAARWNNQAAKPVKAHTDVIRNGYERNTNHKPLTNNHKPLTKKNKHNGITKVTPGEIVSLYNNSFSGTNAVQKLKPTPAVNQRLSTCIKNEFKTIDEWHAFFAAIKRSEFLSGKIPPSNGYKQFRLKLEWLIQPTNLSKILEGHYHEQ